MRFIVNEDVTGTVIHEIRQRGHDALSAKESMRSEPDEATLARAQAELQIVVSHDKDFDELAFRSKLPASCGIILLRLSGADPEMDNGRILESLERRTGWTGHFSVVTDERIRMRPLPSLPARSEEAWPTCQSTGATSSRHAPGDF
jgi:predicted nuclease of predicted toxin-antitoxin system